MATKGSEYLKNPIGKWKVGNLRSKVKQKGHQNDSALGTSGLEEAKFLPKDWTLKEKLSEVKLKYQNLTNELLNKLGISAEDMSEGMSSLEEMMETIFFLQYQIQEEEIFSQNYGWKESCNLPGDESASVQTPENGKEKQESPPMMNGRMMKTCPNNGGAGYEKASDQTQEKVKEKQEHKVSS